MNGGIRDAPTEAIVPLKGDQVSIKGTAKRNTSCQLKTVSALCRVVIVELDRRVVCALSIRIDSLAPNRVLALEVAVGVVARLAEEVEIPVL